MYKEHIRNFTKNDDIKDKYFGNTPHAMWLRNNKLSLIGLGDLKTLIEKIIDDNNRLDIFIKATNRIFNSSDIKSFLKYISESLAVIKSERDK